MLREAGHHPRVVFLQATAEEIPLADEQFDLITAAQAFHWFDQEAFLAESHRLLRGSGWLVVYTSWFTAEMKEQPGFADWFRGDYISKYPTPPRDRAELTEERARRHGFAFRGEEVFPNEIRMSSRRFTDYQLSTTNVLASVERGTTNFEEAARWIQSSIASFFGDHQERTFLFSGKIWYLQKPAGLGESCPTSFVAT
jgi:ubiquinone/menaquinone biosynthesis C-methylase UbiE